MKRRTFLKAGVVPFVLNIVSRVPPVLAAPSDFQSVVEEISAGVLGVEPVGPPDDKRLAA